MHTSTHYKNGHSTLRGEYRKCDGKDSQIRKCVGNFHRQKKSVGKSTLAIKRTINMSAKEAFTDGIRLSGKSVSLGNNVAKYCTGQLFSNDVTLHVRERTHFPTCKRFFYYYYYYFLQK